MKLVDLARAALILVVAAAAGVLAGRPAHRPDPVFDDASQEPGEWT